MMLNEALAKLAPTKSDGFISRPGRPRVRNAVGPAEQVLHRYVIDAPPVEAFDATKEDLAADDWTIGSVKAEADPKAKSAADAEVKVKSEADAKKTK